MKKRNLAVSLLVPLMMGANTMPAFAAPTANATSVTAKQNAQETNLHFPALNDAYKYEKDGSITGKGNGDNFLYSDTQGKDFVYEADVHFNGKKSDIRGAASLVFRADGDHKYMYVANLNGQNGECRIFKFGDPVDLGPIKKVELNDDGNYHLKVIAIGKHILYYVNDQLMINTADYTMSNGHYGQNDALTEGTFGLLTWESNVTYKNVKYTTITDDNSPELSDIKIASNEGKVNMPINFYKGQYVYIAYVSNDTKTVKIETTSDDGSTVEGYDANNKPVDLNAVPVDEKQQVITLKSTKGNANVIYRLRIHRSEKESSYYNEPWRDQYHYSVKDGWANDPNGMVFYKGEWHLYHQYYDATKWGPMHWMHATSKDRIHWTQHSVTVYPDEYGTMYSGSAVVANHQTAPDIFKEGEEGIVYLITANGANGNDDQKIIGAYSKDGEKVYKYDKGKVLIDWRDDPLQNSAFRDPKVFRFDNKWFMVLAGGPLRIYSSDDLVNWKVESTYKDLNTECPDLFPVYVKDASGQNTNEVKWVLSRGGRKYKIGDFKKVDGHYQFVPIAQYKSSNVSDGMGDESNDGTMNFGYDSYAAMTFYRGDFGSTDHYNKDILNDVSAINWMNTWEGGFDNAIPDKNGNTVFNGTFNLILKMGIKKDAAGKYLLTQTPIEGYDNLRDTEHKSTYNNVTLSPDNKIFKKFKSNTYELDAHIVPHDAKTITFAVRVGDQEKTLVTYDVAKEEVTMDRSSSGVIVNDAMGKVKHALKKNEDGSVDLKLYVDKASVELFNGDDTVEGALQIFPKETSSGLKIYSDNNATGDITIYPMKTIWNKLSLSQDEINGYTGSTYKIDANVTGDQKDVKFKLKDSKDVISLTQDGNSASVKALKKGTATITVITDKGITQDIPVTIKDNNFKTNLDVFDAISGKWSIDDENYVGESDDEGLLFNEYNKTKDFTYDADVNWNSDEFSLLMNTSKRSLKGTGYNFTIEKDGSYTLKDMADDTTLASGKAVVTGKDHFQFKKEGQQITVTLNDKELFSVKVTDQQDYTQGYTGVGFNDGDVKLSNVYCSAIKKETPTQDTKKDTPDQEVKNDTPAAPAQNNVKVEKVTQEVVRVETKIKTAKVKVNIGTLKAKKNASLKKIKALLPKTLVIKNAKKKISWNTKAIKAKKSGTYKVTGKAGSVTLTAKIKVTYKDPRLAKVKITKTSYKKNKVTVKWKGIKKVKTYEVAYRTNKKWHYKKVKKTSLKLSVKPSKKYTFKVRTVVGKKKGTFSNSKTVKTK
ncbi:GH32 C-terminal domain-containing protein [Intestinibaculum porci]|uniref:GH32 C-terminal domain-containing protein n=1 Tax=Intestinibaculum porci TaxID=2487118 RepID=UPI00240950BE|nr:GH32 C-terminal domain-containing protein [Intestinibaculum porci]MDD6350454.1 GH32 C-terminal domain-containing protein [Intestinibaculum porci]